MKLFSIIVTAILTLFSAGACLADTLVITYRSGKTQTVILDESSGAINSWQFVAGNATNQSPQQQPAMQQQMPKEAPKTSEKKAVEKPADKKSNIRFQWNAPPIRE